VRTSIHREFTCTIGHVFSSENAWGEHLLGGRFGDKIRREGLPRRLGAPEAVIALHLFRGEGEQLIRVERITRESVVVASA
jgi:hypothetical protein